jgi:serine/threonine protein kinase
MRFATGARLGPFEILNPLGAGGMGEVYRARDTRLDRIVAIKLLPSELLNAPIPLGSRGNLRSIVMPIECGFLRVQPDVRIVLEHPSREVSGNRFDTT